MNLEAFRHFVVLSETLHFARAAQRLAMSQPPLSQSIQKLERSLGVKLFDRTRRLVTLTPEGLALLPVARQIVTEIDFVKFDVARSGGSVGATLHIGYTEDAAFEALPILMNALTRMQPDIGIRLIDMNSAAQADALLAEEIDLAVGYHGPETVDGLAHAPLASAGFRAAIGRDDPSAGEPSLSLAQITADNFLMPPDLPPALVMRLRSASPNRAVFAGSTDSRLRLVESGSLCTIVHSGWEGRIDAGLIYRRLTDFADDVSGIDCRWRRGSRHPVVRELIRSGLPNLPSGLS